LVSVTNTGTGNNVLATAPTIASLNLTTALTIASASGTVGQVLTSGGSGNAPTWSSPSTTSISNGTSNVTVNSSGGTITAATNGTTGLTIDTSQNVLIPGLVRSSGNGFQSGNATDAFAKFAYDGGAAQLNITNEYNSGGAGGAYGQIVFKTYNSSGGSLTERMRLTAGGAFVVGATSTSAIGSGTAGFYATGNNDCGFGTNGTGALGAVTFFNPNGGVGSIQTSGSSTIYNTGSDYRLKENIQPMTNALAKVAQLKPCTYKWKFDGTDGEGFIAHELAEVFPIAVSGQKDEMQTYTDDDGNEQTKPKWQGVDASFLIGSLTAAIQELKALNDTLTARITALENA
jgi:hypothetical protein